MEAALTCPACGSPVRAALPAEALEEARRRGVARAVVACPRGHAIVVTLDASGAVRSAVAAAAALAPSGRGRECEVTPRAPEWVRQRLQAIVERGPATDADELLLERAREAGWVVCA